MQPWTNLKSRFLKCCNIWRIICPISLQIILACFLWINYISEFFWNNSFVIFIGKLILLNSYLIYYVSNELYSIYNESNIKSIFFVVRNKRVENDYHYDRRGIHDRYNVTIILLERESERNRKRERVSVRCKENKCCHAFITIINKGMYRLTETVHIFIKCPSLFIARHWHRLNNYQ